MDREAQSDIDFIGRYMGAIYTKTAIDVAALPTAGELVALKASVDEASRRALMHYLRG